MKKEHADRPEDSGQDRDVDGGPQPEAGSEPVGTEPVLDRDTTVDDRAIVPDRPVLESSGDEVVDAALEQFDRVTGQPLATHIEAAERTHDALQSRLSDLGDG